MQCSSPIPPVFAGKVSFRNSKGFPPSGSVKQEGVGEISSFLSSSVNISKMVADTANVTITEYEVTYGLSIDTKIDDLG